MLQRWKWPPAEVWRKKAPNRAQSLPRVDTKPRVGPRVHGEKQKVVRKFHIHVEVLFFFFFSLSTTALVSRCRESRGTLRLNQVCHRSRCHAPATAIEEVSQVPLYLSLRKTKLSAIGKPKRVAAPHTTKQS